MGAVTEARSHEGAYLVYINGIEVPTQSVDVDMGVWRIPTAVLNMAPDVQLQRLGAEDRLKVEVFYLDDIYTELRGKDPEFCILFEGDIVGWQYTNTPRGRSMAFHCVNQLRIMTDLYPHFITGLETMAAKLFSDTSIGQVSSVHYAPALFVSLLHKGLAPSDELIRRPYDFVHNFLRAVVDTKAFAELGCVAAPNFFGRQMRQVNFLNRFVPSPILETDVMQKDVDDGGIFPILSALKKDAVVKAIITKVMQLGNNVSSWEMIRQLFMLMYYEVLPITTPPIAQVNATDGSNSGVIMGPPKWKRDTIREGLLKSVKGADASIVYQAAIDAVRPNRMLNYITKPQWLFGVPPSCNVIFPSMIREFTYKENFDAQPTRMYINDERVRNVSANGQLPSLMSMSVGYPEIVQKELDKKGNPEDGSNAALSGKNFLIWPEEFYRGPRVARDVLPEWFQYLEDAKKTSHPTSSEEGRVSWEALKEVQKSYAKYEYHRNRAQHRSGAVRMVFNPYIIPGFPTAIFDNVSNGNHMVAYVLNVSHHLEVGKQGTRINYTYGQIMSELMHEIIDARSGNTPSGEAYPNIAAAPPHPIGTLRDVLQDLGQSEEYFKLLLHQGQSYSGGRLADQIKTAAFYFPHALELVLPSGEEKFAAEVIDKLDRKTLNQFVEYQPSAIFANIFSNPDESMRYVSRPICTLDEFIDFQQVNGRRINRIDRFDEAEGKGAVYYEQIRDMSGGGEDTAVAFDENNNLTTPPIADLPATRIDWTTRLKNYRIKVKKQVHPQEA
jgi:hypothetical protein